MAKKMVPLLNWRVTSASGMSARATLVRNGLTNFPLVFPAPPIGAVTLQTKTKTLTDNYATRKNGINAKNDYDDACADMDAALRQIAGYVSTTANGSKEIINQGGYDNSKDSVTKETVLPVIGNVVNVEVIKGGTVDLATKLPTGAKNITLAVFLGEVFDLAIIEDAVSVPASTEPRAEVRIISGCGARKKLKGFVKGTTINLLAIGHNTLGYGPLGPVTPGLTI